MIATLRFVEFRAAQWSGYETPVGRRFFLTIPAEIGKFLNRDSERHHFDLLAQISGLPNLCGIVTLCRCLPMQH